MYRRSPSVTAAGVEALVTVSRSRSAMIGADTCTAQWLCDQLCTSPAAAAVGDDMDAVIPLSLIHI